MGVGGQLHALAALPVPGTRCIGVCPQCGSQCCHLGFIKKALWLIAGHIDPISGRGILSAFLRLSHENWDGWFS